MKIRQWLVRRRRTRCARRGHPQALWSPVVMSERGPVTVGVDFGLEDGVEFVTYAYRCAIHDRRPS